MTSVEIAQFTDVDHTADPSFFKRFLDEGNALESIRAAKPIILGALRLAHGQRCLDVGCGTGDDVAEIAERVGPDGEADGVDVSEAMIGEARERARDSGVKSCFEVGDAQDLKYAAGSFDACRAERVLMHVPDANRAVSEMARVVRPGGRVCVFDFDWDTHFVDSPYRDTTRTIVRSFADGIRSGWIGRQLPRLLKQNGFTDVASQAHTVFIPYAFYELLLGGHLTAAQRSGILNPGDVRRWWEQLRLADESACFTAGVTALIVSGTKDRA